jgi:hypothetical protein
MNYPALSHLFTAFLLLLCITVVNAQSALVINEIMASNNEKFADEAVYGGYHELSIDASIWASGIYLVVAESGGRRLTVPVTLIK